jgi:hypothetical protein
MIWPTASAVIPNSKIRNEYKTARAFDQLYMVNLIEEIEDMGRSEKRTAELRLSSFLRNRSGGTGSDLSFRKPYL